MEAEPKPGPKPKHLFLRIVRTGDRQRDDLPTSRSVRTFVDHLEGVGRLIAHGVLSHPDGDAVLLRAADRGEAERSLRTDPFRSVPGTSYELLEWNPGEFGSGVNLDPPPARGSGRLTVLQRVAVVVRDQAASVRWYGDVLGLRIRVHEPETGYVELSLGRGTAALSLVAPRPEWGEPYYTEAMARIGQRTGIAFQTDSVNALELRLRHAGARVTQPAEPQPWGGVALRFADPDGNEFLAFESTASSGARRGNRSFGVPHGLATSSPSDPSSPPAPSPREATERVRRPSRVRWRSAEAD